MLLLLSILSLPGQNLEKRPNVVFILADDLGYGETGVYGQTKIRTPNIDRLASEGVRLTQHYTGAPVCAPARCVLMTGKHLAHAEIRGNRDSGNGRMFPGQWPITAEALTMAEVFQSAGYRVGGFGKWGLGPTNTTGSPMKQGFDRFFGYNCQRNAHSYFPFFLDSNEREVRINPGLIFGHQRKDNGEVIADDYRLERYAPDVILDEALKFLDQTRDRPFFLYLPFVEPHVAMQPPQEWVDAYPESWDEEKGSYRGQNGYLPHPRPRAAYAAMISDLDEHVGMILNRIEAMGVADNTIIVFTSDNGTTHPGGDPDFHIGGVDAPFFNSTAGLRGWKGSVYEGGLRVPCIVRWPGKIQSGTLSHDPSYFPDWFPTLTQAAGLKTPEGLDGVDLGPLLQGETECLNRKDPLIWEFAGYGGQVALRDGKWKAVRTNLNRKDINDWELYDLEKDAGEKVDLAPSYPEIVRRMESIFLKTRTVEPDFPNAYYDPLTQP